MSSHYPVYRQIAQLLIDNPDFAYDIPLSINDDIMRAASGAI